MWNEYTSHSSFHKLRFCLQILFTDFFFFLKAFRWVSILHFFIITSCWRLGFLNRSPARGSLLYSSVFVTGQTCNEVLWNSTCALNPRESERTIENCAYNAVKLFFFFLFFSPVPRQRRGVEICQYDYVVDLLGKLTVLLLLCTPRVRWPLCVVICWSAADSDPGGTEGRGEPPDAPPSCSRRMGPLDDGRRLNACTLMRDVRPAVFDVHRVTRYIEPRFTGLGFFFSRFQMLIKSNNNNEIIYY